MAVMDGRYKIILRSEDDARKAGCMPEGQLEDRRFWTWPFVFQRIAGRASIKNWKKNIRVIKVSDR